MKKTKLGNLIGSWSFLVGVILAVIIGLFKVDNPNLSLVLVVIGVVIGLLNVADEEVSPFLFSGAVLILASYAGGEVLDKIGQIANVFNALLAVFVPATIIVAIKNVFSLAKN